MPSKYLRKGPNKLKKCSERRTNSCGPETDGCCGVIACNYCLTWEGYEGTDYGTAEFSGTAWTGTVGGAEFIAYWEKTFDEYPDEPTSVGNSVGMSFARVVGGEFQMGSPSDEPGRDADEDLQSEAAGTNFVGVSPVTQQQFFDVMGRNPSHFIGDDRPVEMVSWSDALQFCSRLSARTAEIIAGRTYRLPTEAEWEWACRAGTTTAYHFGNDPADLTTYGWYADNSGGETRDKLTKAPNTNQLYDMPGNVWEWCFTSRIGDGENNLPVRGGGWNSPVEDCRSASREVVPETTRRNDIGFRVICTYNPPREGLCEFVVNFDGEEVYRKSCYEGQSCRDSSDSAEASIGYETGTLRWEKYEARPLPTVVDPITGCRVHFCGTCHCTTRCLCVAINTAIVEGYGSTQYAGEICDITYSDCEGPNWSGTVGGIAIDLQLDADEYDGSCFVHGTIAGESVSQSISSDCSAINLTFTLEDGATVQITSKECACAEDEPGICMCNRGFGQSPTIAFASANAMSTIHTVTLSYSANIDDGLVCTPIMPCQGYTGRFEGVLALPMGGSAFDGIDFRLVCSLECGGYCLYFRYDSRTSPGWCRSDTSAFDCVCPATIVYEANTNMGFPCTIDPGYQILEFVFEEDVTNCD